MGVQTLDDVICNYGPPVSRERIASTLNTWKSDYPGLQHSAGRLTVGDLPIISSG